MSAEQRLRFKLIVFYYGLLFLSLLPAQLSVGLLGILVVRLVAFVFSITTENALGLIAWVFRTLAVWPAYTLTERFVRRRTDELEAREKDGILEKLARL